MFFKIEYFTFVPLIYNSKFVVKFKEGFEFSLIPQHSKNNNYIFQATDFNSDFEITSISCGNIDVPYNKEDKTFVINCPISNKNFFFCILASVEYKKVGYVCIRYALKFPADRIRQLKLHEFYEEYFVLPNYEHIEIKYYIKKSYEMQVELDIENPLHLQIEDVNRPSSITTDNFQHTFKYLEPVDINLMFVFDPLNDKKLTQIQNHPAKSANNSLYEALSNTDFADVVIFSSSNKEILSYRCVLAKYSTYFAKQIYDSKEIPVKFNLKDDDTETIKAALDFCYGKTDSIIGKEAKLFEFAVKYEFDELKHACSIHFEKSVNPNNVCEIVEIAYSNNFENLMQKCNKILAENKEKIDPAELQKLPKDILIKLFFT